MIMHIYMKNKNTKKIMIKRNINNVWKADQEFINESNNQNDDPVMGKDIIKLNKSKKIWITNRNIIN